MKTVTIITIILFITAVFFLGFVFSKYSSSKTSSSSQAVESNQADTITKEETNSTVNEKSGHPAEEEQEQEFDENKIKTIEIYLDGDKDNGTSLGEAIYGLTSQEASKIYGQDFSETGFILIKNNEGYTFEPGSVHYLYLYVLIPKYGWSYMRQKVVVPGETNNLNENIKLSIESPPQNETIKEDDKSNIRISGWTFDSSSHDNTGIDRVEIYLNGPKDFGKFLGRAEYGIKREDVANAFANANYTNSGYSFSFDGSNLEPGSDNTLYIYSFSSSGSYYLGLIDFRVEGEKEESNAIISAKANLGDQSIEISGWAINKYDILEGKPRNLDIEYSVKKIVFTSNRNGNEDLYIINIDGTELTQLTDHPGKDNYPAISPDGEKIAYTSDINGTWQIMVMNADGTEKIQLTQNPYNSGYPSWSFDGRFIYFEVFMEGDWEIYRINSDGSNMKRLTLNPNIPDWHPCGHPFQYEVLYESGTIGNEDLYIMSYDGNNSKKISDINMRKRTPAISIDGKTIAFMGYKDKDSSIYIMDSNGENIKKVSGSLIKCCHPNISPDNKYITFDSGPDGQADIYIVNIDGSNLIRLTDTPGNDYDPVFLYK